MNNKEYIDILIKEKQEKNINIEGINEIIGHILSGIYAVSGFGTSNLVKTIILKFLLSIADSFIHDFLTNNCQKLTIFLLQKMTNPLRKLVIEAAAKNTIKWAYDKKINDKNRISSYFEKSFEYWYYYCTTDIVEHEMRLSGILYELKNI